MTLSSVDIIFINNIKNKNKKIDKKVFSFILGECIKSDPNRDIKVLKNELATFLNFKIEEKIKKEPHIKKDSKYLIGYISSELNEMYCIFLENNTKVFFNFWEILDENNSRIPKDVSEYLKQTILYR